MTSRARTATGVVGLVALGAAIGSAISIRRLRTWGATPAEAADPLPGDELIPDPADTTTRAIGIDAPAETVWRWLVQVGTDRGGWYTHDLLERLVGVPVHNTDVIRDEWQHLDVGDRVCLAPEGWMGVPAGMILPVVDLVAGQHIVLRQSPPSSPWDGVWSFHVRECGPERCRLLIRSRTARPAGAAGVAARIASPVMGIVTGVMERGMLPRDPSAAPRAPSPTATSTDSDPVTTG